MYSDLSIVVNQNHLLTVHDVLNRFIFDFTNDW